MGAPITPEALQAALAQMWADIEQGSFTPGLGTWAADAHAYLTRHMTAARLEPIEAGGCAPPILASHMPFAKLFDTAHGQLLVTLEEGPDEDPALMLRAACVEGITPSIRLDFDTEAEQLERFAAYDQQQAEKAAVGLHKMVAKLMGGTA